MTDVRVLETNGVSDHKLVTCVIGHPLDQTKTQMRSFRDIKNIDITKFKEKWTSSPVFHAPEQTTDAFVNQTEDTVSGLIDELAPIQTRKVVNKRHATPWLSKEAISAKRNR